MKVEFDIDIDIDIDMPEEVLADMIWQGIFSPAKLQHIYANKKINQFASSSKPKVRESSEFIENKLRIEEFHNNWFSFIGSVKNLKVKK